jgi:hypothetical protein
MAGSIGQSITSQAKLQAQFPATKANHDDLPALRIRALTPATVTFNLGTLNFSSR